MLELRRLDSPGQVGQAGLLPLLSSGEELLHLVQELRVLQQRLQGLPCQRRGEIHSLTSTVTNPGSRNLVVIFVFSSYNLSISYLHVGQDGLEV